MKIPWKKLFGWIGQSLIEAALDRQRGEKPQDKARAPSVPYAPTPEPPTRLPPTWDERLRNAGPCPSCGKMLVAGALCRKCEKKTRARAS